MTQKKTKVRKRTPSKEIANRARRVFEVVGSVKRTALALACSEVEIREALAIPETRGRKPKPVYPVERERLARALRRCGSSRRAAESLGMSQSTFLRRIKQEVARPSA